MFLQDSVGKNLWLGLREKTAFLLQCEYYFPLVNDNYIRYHYTFYTIFTTSSGDIFTRSIPPVDKCDTPSSLCNNWCLVNWFLDDFLSSNKNAFQSKMYHSRNIQIIKALTFETKFIPLHLTSIMRDLDLQMTLTFKHVLSGIQAHMRKGWEKYDILFIWPWNWPNDIGTQTWPRYGQDVSACEKVPSYSGSKVMVWTDGQTDRQTDRQTRVKLLPTCIRGW